MELTLAPDLAVALKEFARKQGVTPEILANNALRERFLAPAPEVRAQDEWGRGLLAAASDCGVSLSNEAVGSEGLYE